MARIVVALGGNALQKNGEADAESQKKVASETARQLVILVQDGHEVVLVHGNGPQVGTILLHEETASDHPAPLDTCVAMSQGEIGYWLQQVLGNELRAIGAPQGVATIVTQVQVAPDDPAFQNPSKPIGLFYPDKATAEAAAGDRQVTVKEDAGRGWRRVVASPRPVDIIEKNLIKQVIDAGNIVVAAGGGGVPVVLQDGVLTGVEAVIDKDFAAEKLAELVDADILLILTAVPAVTVNYLKPDETPLGSVTADDLEAYIEQGQFAPGSMLPKVQAAQLFAHAKPGAKAIITAPDTLGQAMRGETGTHVTA